MAEIAAMLSSLPRSEPFPRQLVHFWNIYRDGYIYAVHNAAFFVITFFPQGVAGVFDVIPNCLNFGAEQVDAVLISQYPRFWQL